MTLQLRSCRFSAVPKLKVGLVQVERKRPWPDCINPETGRQWRDDVKSKVLEVLNEVVDEVVRIDQSIKVDDDHSAREAIALCESHDVDVLVLIQPTIGDGRLAPVLAQSWQHSMVLWATPEEQRGEMISGNSLVGTHLMAANLIQLGFKVELVIGNLDWTLAQRQLRRGLRVSYALRFMKRAKLGLIGGHAPGFQDFHSNPALIQSTFGAIIQHIGLIEYITLAMKLVTKAEVELELEKERWQVLKSTCKNERASSPEFRMEWVEIESSVRHFLALRRLIEENNLDAIAIRCWPELPSPLEAMGMDSWCYLALALLASDGYPVACEGDIDGALSNLIAKLLGCGTVYLSDWLEHDSNTLTLWHGGMAPLQLSESIGSPLGPCLSRHFNNKKIGCLDATIKIDMDVTIFRVWTFKNHYHLVTLQGRTVAPKRHLLGNNGLVCLDESEGDLVASFNEWVQHGFPHHVSVVQGHHANAIRTFATKCGIKVL